MKGLIEKKWRPTAQSHVLDDACDQAVRPTGRLESDRVVLGSGLGNLSDQGTGGVSREDSTA
jgi:hypothetical protein